MDTCVPALGKDPGQVVDEKDSWGLRGDWVSDDRANGEQSDGDARRRMMVSVYVEADAPERSYDRAVGWALQYGILVYRPGTGGRMKALDTLRQEIEAYEIEHGLVTPQTRHRLRNDGMVQAYCTDGHPATVWGSPMVAKPGEQVRWRGSPSRCRCQALIYGGRR